MVDAVTIRANGKAEMAYVQGHDKPWHGLGDTVAPGASIEEWVKAAGMDWKIRRSRVRYGEGANQLTLDDSHVLFRSDTKAPLGIVSDKYRVFQPAETLEFFRDLLPEGFELNTAGTLYGGKKFWALASIGEEFTIGSRDRLRGFILAASSADGSIRTTFKNVITRVVCDNTLTAGMSERGVQVAISHRSTVDAAAVKEKLGLAREQFHREMAQLRRLAETPVTQDEVDQFLGELLVETQMVTKKDVTKSKAFVTISDLFNGSGLGATLDGADGTLWGLLNAVTEYVDHHAKAADVSNRLDSAWFGRGDAFKNAAAQKALALV